VEYPADLHKAMKRHRRWQDWYHFFSNRNPLMIEMFPKIVEEDKAFRKWIKEGK